MESLAKICHLTSKTSVDIFSFASELTGLCLIHNVFKLIYHTNLCYSYSAYAVHTTSKVSVLVKEPCLSICPSVNHAQTKRQRTADRKLVGGGVVSFTACVNLMYLGRPAVMVSAILHGSPAYDFCTGCYITICIVCFYYAQ